MGMTRKSCNFCFKTSQMGLFWLILPGLVDVLYFPLRVGVQLACFLWSDMRRSVHAGVSPGCILPPTKGNERFFFSQPLDLRGCNHMAITPSWRAPFISPSHLWLPAPGFISPATDWWNSAAFVQCNPAYAYISGHQLWILVDDMGSFGLIWAETFGVEKNFSQELLVNCISTWQGAH